MKFSDSIKNIAIALAQFQGEVTAAPKDAINPHFKKKYATLDGMITAIRPALAKCGLSFIQNNIEDEAGRIGVYTMLFHESGENITFDPVYIPLDRKTAQGIGSALTYSRRYSLGTALGIATDEDDDGNSIEPERKKYDNKQTTSNKPQPTQPEKPEPEEEPVDKMTEGTLTKIKNVWESTNLAPELINKQTDKYFKLPLNELSESQGKQLLEIFEAKKSETKETKKNRYAALFAAGKEQRLNTDQVKELVYSKYTIESLTKLDDATLEKATKWIKSGGKEDPAEDSRKKLMQDMKKIANGQKKVS